MTKRPIPPRPQPLFIESEYGAWCDVAAGATIAIGILTIVMVVILLAY